jgi:hypothetical protein
VTGVIRERLAPFGIAIAMLSGASACERRSSPPPPRVTQPMASGSAHDRLAPGEAPPGVEHAFELALPRGARIDRGFGNEIYAIVNGAPEVTATQFREALPGVEAIVGPNGTIFPNVTLAGAPAKSHLRISISAAGDGRTTRITVVRWEDPPTATTLSHDELMKRSGLTPDGKLLDPKHLD